MFAKAIKEYEAEDDSNITIKKGDLVVVTDRSEEDWWEGYVSTREPKLVGLFPSSYVEELKVEERGVIMKSMDYGNKGYLTLRAGDVVSVVEKLNDVWFKAFIEEDLKQGFGLIHRNAIYFPIKDFCCGKCGCSAETLCGERVCWCDTCSQSGGCFIDYQNKLAHMYMDGWGRKKGKLWTPLETGFDPPFEEVQSLEMNGFRILGKIVCKGGVVFNGDTPHKLKSLEEEEGKRLTKLYEEKKLFFMEGGVNEPTDKFRGPPTRMDIPYDDRNIPRGRYTLKKQSGNNVSLCDVGDCCDMAHYMLDKHNRCKLSEKESRSFLHFLKRRPMYTKSDLELGNVDVCYQCLGKEFYRDMREPETNFVWRGPNGWRGLV